MEAGRSISQKEITVLQEGKNVGCCILYKICQALPTMKKVYPED